MAERMSLEPQRRKELIVYSRELRDKATALKTQDEDVVYMATTMVEYTVLFFGANYRFFQSKKTYTLSPTDTNVFCLTFAHSPQPLHNRQSFDSRDFSHVRLQPPVRGIHVRPAAHDRAGHGQRTLYNSIRAHLKHPGDVESALADGQRGKAHHPTSRGEIESRGQQGLAPEVYRSGYLVVRIYSRRYGVNHEPHPEIGVETFLRVI